MISSWIAPTMRPTIWLTTWCCRVLTPTKLEIESMLCWVNPLPLLLKCMVVGRSTWKPTTPDANWGFGVLARLTSELPNQMVPHGILQSAPTDALPETSSPPRTLTGSLAAHLAPHSHNGTLGLIIGRCPKRKSMLLLPRAASTCHSWHLSTGAR